MKYSFNYIFKNYHKKYLGEVGFSPYKINWKQYDFINWEYSFKLKTIRYIIRKYKRDYAPHTRTADAFKIISLYDKEI